jgi:hypothetical protein
LVSNEAKTARAPEVALGVRVDFITVNVDAKKMDSLAEIVHKVNAVIRNRNSLLELSEYINLRVSLRYS